MVSYAHRKIFIITMAFWEAMKTEKTEHQIGVGGFRLKEAEKRNVMKVLDSNRLNYGDFSRKFESEFARLHCSKFGVMSNSGTDALRIAIAALKEKRGWKDGDEVIVPALTFIATSNVVIQNNLIPVFVDVEKEYYGIDSEKIEEAITPRTRAIIPVHLFGMPAQMDRIMEIAKKHRLAVVEDACETPFAKFNGKAVGTFGDIGAFSMYAAHVIVTGVGGISLTNDAELAVMMRSLVNHGRDSIYLSIDDDKTTDRKKLKEIISKRFKFVRLGFSARVTEMEAAIGVAQLERKDEIVEERQRNAAFLTSKLKKFESELQLPKFREGAEHVFMMFPIVIKGNRFTKEQLVNFLEENNIETRDMVPLTNQPVYKKIFGNDLEERYPVAKWINHNGFYIGCHNEMTQQDLEYVAEKFEEFFRKV